MSNVIIGIIGVILFIGLAIASATYLGSGVTDAKSTIATASIINSGEQTASAVKVYKIRTKQNMPNGLDTISRLMTANLMKAVPSNPLAVGYTPFTADASGAFGSDRPSWVLMSLGQSELSMKACIEIERSLGNADRLDPATMSTTISFASRAGARPGRPGCHRNATAYGGSGGAAGDYLAYFPV